MLPSISDQQTIIILISITLGVMIFFSFAIAPLIFKVLNENYARLFVRRIFPYYYSINLILLSIAIFVFYRIKLFNLEFFLISFTAFIFFLSLFILMPLINKSRDNNKNTMFKHLHSCSVFFNFIQIIILIYFLL